MGCAAIILRMYAGNLIQRITFFVALLLIIVEHLVIIIIIISVIVIFIFVDFVMII